MGKLSAETVQGGGGAEPRIILVVEDNDDDFEAVDYALRMSGGAVCTIERCVSGQDALDYLFGSGAYAGQERPRLPSLILLDLNLLGVTGREVLTQIKSDVDLKKIPVIVMTSSTDRRDIDACYRAGANAYLQKEMELDRLFRSIAVLKKFWMETVVLPGDNA